MLRVEVGDVSIIRQTGGQVEMGLRELGWGFQRVTLAEAELIGRALIAAAEEVEDA